MTIEVYTQPGCKHCDDAVIWLESYGYDFAEVNVRTHPEALEQLVNAGLKTTPVLVVDGNITATQFTPDNYAEALNV